MAGRGVLTPEIKQKAKELLGIEDLSTDELRFMPYIQYQMMNDQKIEPQRVNAGDRKILSKWRENGWIEGGAAGLGISKDFWDAIHEILWMAYVDYDG